MPVALLLAVAALAQEVPIVDGRQHTLDRMSADLSAEIASCGTTAVFIIPRGKTSLGDAQAVIDAAATPEQIACAKMRISWLATAAEARERGW